ncbi:hypothetical protein OEZ71_01215 [Defluviimonas sp. WL0050]|uniref:EF hand n=1 Tax=Albidovulum litorale TaxID=2984134 RepID=A0ABT2ZIF9_9RHOB|nr:hypothetical protein [Defluviimonas sp. WL0050]MCV2870909.1 hypothetical protein [Defluviimonas sp. WL0050]
MISRLLLPTVIAILSAAAPAAAEIKFIRPGESPAEQVAEPELGSLDLDAVYRGLDLLDHIRARMSRGAIVAGLVRNFAKEDVDGSPGITDADRELAARVEIAQARARAAQPWAENDLDSDGIVTRAELMAVGRTRYDDKARRQGLGNSIELTDEQREALVLDYVSAFLARDFDGDDAVTYDEAVASVDADRILTRLRTEGGALDPVWDADGNGMITEAEVRLSAGGLLELIDVNDDNVVDTEEARVARQAFFKARARAGDPSRGGRIRCTLPEVPRSAEVVIIQGDSGAAVTNLAFAEPNDEVVRMAEVMVPDGATDMYLIASMRSPTVLRLTGPGVGRVKAVIGVAATVALDGGAADLANTPCHRGFLGIRIVEPGGVATEFGRALGRDDLRAVVAKRLGRVDLGTLTNGSDGLLENDALPVMMGDGQFIVDRFLSFDPGGYQMLDPDDIQSTVPVRARDMPPLEIGLIVLASEGKIDFVAPPPGFLSRNVPEGIKRIVPENESTDGVVWQDTPGGGSHARFPLTVVVRRAIELPAGLTTERGVRLIVPDGVPKPRGAKNWSIQKN